MAEGNTPDSKLHKARACEVEVSNSADKDSTGLPEQSTTSSSDSDGDEAQSDTNTLSSLGESQRSEAAEEKQDQDSGEESKENPMKRERDLEVLDYARRTGKLPCVLWRPRNPVPTFCEKDLATGRYTLLDDKEDMTAIVLISKYGPKGGWQSRMPNAIHIVRYIGEHADLPYAIDSRDHASHGEWYGEHMFEKEMKEIEMAYKGAWQIAGQE